MAKKRKSSIGGCLFELIKWMFIIALWPISLIVYVAKWYQREKEKLKADKPLETQTIEVKLTKEDLRNLSKNNDDFDKRMEQIQEEYTQQSETFLRDHYTRQLNESLRLIKETNNISTLFSRLSFLRQLRKNVISYGEGDLSDVIDTIEAHIEMREEYINLFILKRLAETEENCTGASPAVVKRKYKTLYQRFDNYKSRMGEDNIRMYTTECQRHMDVDTLNLPTYSKLLTRLNNSMLGAAIDPEYYSDQFRTTSEAVQFLKQKGYLTVSEDNKKYALTELGTKETGWL